MATFALTILVLYTMSNLPLGPPAPPKVEIESAEEEEKVERCIVVYGSSRHVPEDKEIWVFVQTWDTERKYPSHGRAELAEGGRWSVSVRLGAEDYEGMGFGIIAVLADPVAQNELKHYVETSEETGKWPGLEYLPDGVEEYDRVSVIRAQMEADLRSVPVENGEVLSRHTACEGSFPQPYCFSEGVAESP